MRSNIRTADDATLLAICGPASRIKRGGELVRVMAADIVGLVWGIVFPPTPLLWRHCAVDHGRFRWPPAALVRRRGNRPFLYLFCCMRHPTRLRSQEGSPLQAPIAVGCGVGEQAAEL
ncbi:MAG: hypothetical protein D6753_02485 [Planctomycetota bacterium]|nr:MAG: hypothetical protein D6753_02485 [Planctomycetota bacterium]